MENKFLKSGKLLLHMFLSRKSLFLIFLLFIAFPFFIYADCDVLFSNVESLPQTEKLSYQSAMEYIQSQGIKTAGEFKIWSRSKKRPKYFPSHPDRVYKKEWKSWGEFLGTGNISSHKMEWMEYFLAKKYIQLQGIKSKTEFRNWSKSKERPKDFPSDPRRTYKSEWEGWGEFLGTGNLPSREREWMNYQSAKSYIQQFGMKKLREFQKWSESKERPDGFPSNPNQVYKSEWEGWKKFLGTYWMSFEKSQFYAIKVEKITNPKDFIAWLKSDERPRNFPPEPHKHYPEWTSAADFLKIKWIPYREAQKYVQYMGIKTPEEFVEWIKSEEDLPNIPINPSQIYKKEWKSWEEFFGLLGLNDTSSEKFISVSDKTKINGNNFKDEEFVDDEDFLIDYGEDEILKENFFESNNIHIGVYE